MQALAVLAPQTGFHGNGLTSFRAMDGQRHIRIAIGGNAAEPDGQMLSA
jgi:hypothetical protein